MAVRHEALGDEELARQRSLTRSWVADGRALDDAEFRAYLEQSIGRLNESTSTAVLSREQLLHQTDTASVSVPSR